MAEDAFTRGRGSRTIHGLEKLLEAADTWLVAWRSLKIVIKAVMRGMPIQGNGIRIEDTPDGQIISVAESAGGGAEADHPYRCPKAASAEMTISPGSVNGLPTTLDGDPLTSLPMFSVSLVGEVWVYLSWSWDLTISHGYVLGGIFGGSVIGVGSSLPDSTNDTQYIPVATYNNGVRVAQFISTSLTATVCDDNTGSSTSAHDWQQA